MSSKNQKDKVVSIVGCTIASIALLYLILASFGVTNDYFGWDARHSGWAWKLIAIFCYAIATIIFFLMASNTIETTKGAMRIAVAVFVIGLVSGAGFKGTAGDIKQRITCFEKIITEKGKVSYSLDGKVDPACLKKYYNDFYRFDEDTELWDYVVRYRELPGVNNWAFNIREGTTKPSTAPRANENFQWHTGAYHMDLKDKNVR